MIYPSTTGKADGKELRLRTMESIWLQGKLKMWGRWASYSEMPEAVSMFKGLLKKNAITAEDIERAIDKLRKSGCTSSELEFWMFQMQRESATSSLVFCTEREGALMDKVICETLANSPGLLSVLKMRYLGAGRSKLNIAEDLNEMHPNQSLKTCIRRVDSWLIVTEFMLYVPMSDAFGVNPHRFER